MSMRPSDARAVGEILAMAPIALTLGPIVLLADALLPLIERKYGEQIERRPLLRSLYGMVRRGTIQYDEPQRVWRLTDKGIRRVRTYQINDLVLPPPPRRWDGQWRLIAFDIPERSRHLRMIFQRRLQALGLTYLQRSLWMYPFPCEREIRDLALRLGLENDIVIALSSNVSPDERFRRKYQLPPRTM